MTLDEIKNDIRNASCLEDLSKAEEKLKLLDGVDTETLEILEGWLEEKKKRLEEEKKRLEEEKKRLEEEKKERGEYWSIIDQVWHFGVSERYEGCFAKALDYRKSNQVGLYNHLKNVFQNDDEGIETILKRKHDKGEDDVDTVFSDDKSWEVETVDSSKHSSIEAGKAKERSTHDGAHCKNLLGNPTKKNSKSRAHLLPKDKECMKWWWPEYRLFVGDESNHFSASALEKFTELRTNKIVFPCEHNHIFDTLDNGVVCMIPLYESLEELSKWQYQKGFRMLMVCDKPQTYLELGILSEKPYGHIETASIQDLDLATELLKDAMKILANSLESNWDEYYTTLDEGKRKEKMARMRSILADANSMVFVPNTKAQVEKKFKLCVIDYSKLYDGDEEGAKYIPDPFPLLIKSAINLSAFVQKQKGTGECKLLTACAFLEDDESESESSPADIVAIYDRMLAKESGFDAVMGREIGVPTVSDSDEEVGSDQEADSNVGGIDDLSSISSGLTA